MHKLLAHIFPRTPRSNNSALAANVEEAANPSDSLPLSQNENIPDYQPPSRLRQMDSSRDVGRHSLDPISRLQAPPSDETIQQKTERLSKEDEARKVSDNIDRVLEKERKEILQKAKHRREDVFLLLLGPSGSGKSTFLRQLRLMYDAPSLESEREAYRLIIFLSLIHTTRCLLDLLETRVASPSGEAAGGPSLGARSMSPGATKNEAALKRMRLAPLLGLEEKLRKHIGVVPGPSSAAFSALSRRSFDTPDSTHSSPESIHLELQSDAYHVFPHQFKISLLSTFASVNRSQNRSSHMVDAKESGRGGKWVAAPGDPTYILESCRDEVVGLWAECVDNGLVADEGPRNGLEGGARLSESARYFLDSIDRIASKSYQPSDEDIVNVRLRTVGVEEHTLQVESQVYRIIDVAGAKGTRHIWAAFFEHARAVIFIVSLAEYDMPSVHDNGVNAVEDAIEAFGTVVKNRLLGGVDMILFLNKIDILKRKLSRSAQQAALPTALFKDYKRPNEYKPFCTYLRDRFKDVHAEHRSAEDRVLFTHFTQATDIKQSRATIMSIKDTILRGRLAYAGLM